ncbi:hypothetical protein CFP56_030863 [Quercus suber]|uniref:Uncharacterized protein n=1 Tax=Quercus suber TaxID=58331 RepID=A0AAW0JLV0_QUESU
MDSESVGDFGRRVFVEMLELECVGEKEIVFKQLLYGLRGHANYLARGDINPEMAASLASKWSRGFMSHDTHYQRCLCPNVPSSLCFAHKPISNNLRLSRGLSPKMSPTLMDSVANPSNVTGKSKRVKRKSGKVESFEGQTSTNLELLKARFLNLNLSKRDLNSQGKRKVIVAFDEEEEESPEPPLATKRSRSTSIQIREPSDQAQAISEDIPEAIPSQVQQLMKCAGRKPSQIERRSKLRED